MGDHSELKRAASAAKNWGGEVGEQRWYLAECFKRPYFSAQDAEFIAACDPGRILALIAENERQNAENKQLVLLECHGGTAEAAINLLAERDQLKAENERLQESHEQICTNYNRVSYASEERGKQIDQLRAEVAGLKTGYEAYERVNAELKAEVEGLRKLGPSKEIIWCACGDGYPVNSHGAGFMDANNGVCANCDAALGQGEQS